MSARNFIKNKKGFTLPELLAAVVIIGILSTIAIVSVNNVMKKSHKEYDKKQNKLFTTAAQTYFTDNRSELPKKLLTEKEITLEKLIEENYIEKIVDYKKELYNQKESKAYVKKMGRGRYKYYSELVGSDGRKITDKETSKKSSNISVNINNYDTTETDMRRAIDGVYYVNKKLKMRVSGSASSDGISSWQYKIEKLEDENDVVGKKYKSSGEIEVDKESFEDTITINAKDFANGTYKLIVYAYGYDGNMSNYEESKTIVIDKTKPKCEIEMSRKPDGLEVNPTDFGITDGKKYNWYKKGDLIAKMNITETNKYKYTLGLNEQTYNINYNEENKKTEEEYTIGHNVVGKYIYGYIQDKAGNVGKCNTEKPIYYDKTEPSCKISKVLDNPDGEHGWYISDVTLNLESDDNTDLNGESGVRDQELTTTNPYSFPTPVPPIYSNNTNNTQGETTGITYYGYVRDKAGNKGECQTDEIKVDTVPPTCTTKVTGIKGEIDGNETGWYTSNVEIFGECSDTTNGSGCTGHTSKIITYNTTGEDVNLGDVYDNAGHSGICETKTIKIDKTQPSWKTNCNGNSFCNGNGITSEYNDIWFNKKNYENSSSLGYRMGQFYDPSISGIYSIKRYVNNEEKPAAIYPGNGETFTNNYRQTNYYSAEQNNTVCYKLVNNAGLESNLSCVQVKIDRTPPTITFSYDSAGIHNGICNDSGSGVNYVAKYNETGGGYEGTTYGNGSSNTSVQTIWTSNGEKTPSYYCIDMAGNPSSIEDIVTKYCRCYYNTCPATGTCVKYGKDAVGSEGLPYSCAGYTIKCADS